MASITIDVKIDTSKFSSLYNVPNNDEVKLACHEILKKRCDPYVPMQSGILAQSAKVTPEGVTYSAGGTAENPDGYARYQYYGQVYGPSWPIMEHGVIVGWRSPKGRGSKHPTGRALSYSTEKHPLATSFWNKAMYRDHKEEFTKEIKRIIKRVGLNGNR